MEIYYPYIAAVAICFLCYTRAAEWWVNSTDVSFPGKCMVPPNVVLAPGAVIKDPSHECRQITCTKNGMVLYQSCGVSILLPPCHYGGIINASQPYPDCCERVVLCA